MELHYQLNKHYNFPFQSFYMALATNIMDGHDFSIIANCECLPKETKIMAISHSLY